MNSRLLLMAGLLVLLGSGCLVRLWQLQVVEREFWEQEAVKARTRSRSIPFRRGAIRDAGGQLLASSEEVWDLRFQLYSLRRYTRLGNLLMTQFLLTERRLLVRQVMARRAELVDLLATLRVGDYRELQPLQRRRDLVTYTTWLLGGDSDGPLIDHLVEAGDGDPFCPALPRRRDSVLAELEAEVADWQLLERRLGLAPGELADSVDGEIAALDDRVLELLRRREVSERLYQAEKELHTELDQRERDLKKDISWEVAAALRTAFPGLVGRERIRRLYPAEADVCPELIGWVGPPRDDRLRQRNEHLYQLSALLLVEAPSTLQAEEIHRLRQTVREIDYHPDEQQGAFGLEMAYEKALRGRRGYLKRELARDGAVYREVERRAALPGVDLVLTLELEKQRVAEQVLARLDHPAAFVLVELPAQKIRVLASHPQLSREELRKGYTDLVQLTDRIAGNPALALSLPVAERYPLHPRAYGAFFPPPPGSTFKPFVACCALSEKRTTLAQTRPCTYRDLRRPGGTVGCLGHHDDVAVHRALVKSCNHYFALLAEEVGFESLFRWAESFGFGRRTGFAAARVPELDLEVTWTAGEVEGRFKEGETGPRNLMLVGFGQGAIDDVSPLQLAAAMGTLATGRRLPPTLIERVGGYSPERPDPVDLGLAAAARRGVIAALREVTLAEGTAAPDPRTVPPLDLTPYDIASKTGTAQAGGALPDHSWFAGFFPTAAPRYAFAVFLEHTDLHGKDAAPVLQEILQHPAFADVEALARRNPVEGGGIAALPGGGPR